MLSTMQDVPLTTHMLFEHGRRVFGDSEVVTFLGDGSRRASFSTVAARAGRLAAALHRLGVRQGDRVATLCTNTQEHLEAYFAIPGLGAVLHTLNLRLHPDQLAFVINHAEDRVIIVEDILAGPILAAVLPKLDTVEHVIVVGDAHDQTISGAHSYDALLAREDDGFEWPDVDERSAAGMCYTTGTTGEPKGVVYSHRSTVFHTFSACTAGGLGLAENDRVLPIVPMFHVNAWGLPYGAWLAGSDLILPARFMQADALCRLIAAERPTLSGAIPSIWSEVLRHSETTKVDLSSLRLVACGGSAVPRQLIEAFEQRLGVRIVQVWGMTETSPTGAIGHPPKGSSPEEAMDWRAKTGRIAAGVQARVVDEQGRELPWDDQSVGEIEVRGPWVTGSYYRSSAGDQFHDGWLRTGDVGTIDSKGYLQITDRIKDVIKSGGEWISSVELESLLMAHPSVSEAAVIAVPDDRWQERPLACIVADEGAHPAPADLAGFLTGKVAGWWVPERWAVVGEIPKTSVGKIDKKRLRARHAAGEIDVVITSKESQEPQRS